MDLSFMTGATAFALINAFLFILVAYLFYRLGRRAVSYIQNGSKDSIGKVIGFDGAALICIFIFMTFFGSVAQPKLSLDPVANRDLIEYQSDDAPIVINTPAPRTQVLEGFSPLKSE